MTTKYTVIRTEIITVKELYVVDTIGLDKPLSYVSRADPVS